VALGAYVMRLVNEQPHPLACMELENPPAAGWAMRLWRVGGAVNSDVSRETYAQI